MAAAAVADIGFSTMGKAIRTLYAVGESINAFFDEHIEDLRRSENPTVASTGRVLDSAKAGFGLGYGSSLVIIATGQVLLGNPLSAVGTVVAGATLTNPVAMTCAAVGAIYYGWSALSDKEREGILDRLRTGLEVGIELIRAVVDFVIRTTKSLLSSKQLVEFKEFVSTQAAVFGRSLYDVTRKAGDLIKGTAAKIGDMAETAAHRTRDATKEAYLSATEAAAAGKDAAGRLGETVSDGVSAGLARAKLSLQRRPKSEEPYDAPRLEKPPDTAS